MMGAVYLGAYFLITALAAPTVALALDCAKAVEQHVIAIAVQINTLFLICTFVLLRVC